MGKTKNDKELKPKEASEKNMLDDLESFIEKRKLQNDALKKLIPKNGEKQNNQDK